jgi:hypothetical protein
MITTNKYIKCHGNTIENIDGKIKIGFVRCPKCNGWIPLFKDEIGYDGKSIHPLRCTCGLVDVFHIEKLDEEE